MSRNLRQTSLRASFDTAVQVQKSGESTNASQTVNHVSRQPRHGSRGYIADEDGSSAGSGDVRVSATGARLPSNSGEGGHKDGGDHGRAHAGGENAAMARTCPPLRKVRWSSVAHKEALIRALLASPFNGRLPTKLTGWTALASKMPAPSDGEQWDVQTLKRHAKELSKKREDVHG